MKPYFSIIIATYNRKSLIANAIKSVLNQTFEDWQLIIIDDGSSDNTRDVVQEFIKNHETKISYHYQLNKGRSAARNKGISMAKGEFTCFLDSDDYFLPNHLSIFHEVIKLHHYNDYFYYGHTYEDRQGKLSKVAEDKPEKGQNAYDFLFSKPIGTPRVCLKSEVFKEHHFDPNLSVGEDAELWLRIMPRKIICTNKFTQAYLSHDQRSISNGEKPIIDDIKYKKKLYRKYKNRISRSSYYKVISYGYLKLGRSYTSHSRLASLKSLLISFCMRPNDYTKEKFYLILKALLP